MTRGTAGRIVGLWALALSLPLAAHAQVATPLMAGRWSGEAEIAVDWTQQRTLPVNIVIFANDMVTGTVGDAALSEGQIKRNRGWFSSIVHWKTDFVIDAKLTGPIIRGEHVERASVHMPLDWTDGRFEGGISTSGWIAGGPQAAVFAARRLVLHRVPDMTICTSTQPGTGHDDDTRSAIHHARGAARDAHR